MLQGRYSNFEEVEDMCLFWKEEEQSAIHAREGDQMRLSKVSGASQESVCQPEGICAS